MFSFLYSTGFLITALGLVFWFFYRDSAKARILNFLILGGLATYLFSVVFAGADTGQKLWALFRDLIVLGLIAQVFNFLKKYPFVFFGTLILTLGGWFFYYKNIMKATFQPTAVIENFDAGVPLDENGELLIELKNGKDITALQSLAEKYDLNFQAAFQPKMADQTDLDDYFLINIPGQNTENLKEIEAALLKSGALDWLEENEIINLDPTESGASSSKSTRTYPVNDPGIARLWGFDKMEVDKLYKLIRQSGIKPQRKALIAILDTGVEGAHEDLKDNYFSLKKEYDNDPVGHGTHCAGIAGAVSNNGIGIASFSPDNQFVNITSIKVLNAGGRGTQQSIMKGIIEAADAGADVISMSLGGRSTRLSQKAYEDAVKYANKAGAVVVVAAGNSNDNAKYFSPANVPGVITVSAVDTLLNRAGFSNYVEDMKMGVAAPGVQIYSTTPGNNYAALNGTSMATPYVSGLVGIFKSINPKLDTKQVFKLLETTGGSTRDTPKTGKLIQPAAAIEELVD